MNRRGELTENVLRDWMAYVETELLYLHNSIPNSDAEPPEIILNEIAKPVPQKQMEQLTARMNWLEKRLAHKEDTERKEKPDWK